MWPENQRLERAWIPAFSHPNFIPDANTWSLSWSCHYVHVMQHHDIFLNATGKSQSSHRFIYGYTFSSPDGREHIVYVDPKDRFQSVVFRHPLAACTVLTPTLHHPQETGHPWFALEWKTLAASTLCTTVHEKSKDWNWAQLRLGVRCPVLVMPRSSLPVCCQDPQAPGHAWEHGFAHCARSTACGLGRCGACHELEVLAVSWWLQAR